MMFVWSLLGPRTWAHTPTALLISTGRKEPVSLKFPPGRRPPLRAHSTPPTLTPRTSTPTPPLPELWTQTTVFLSTVQGNPMSSQG